MTLARLVRGVAVACAMASLAHAQTVQQAGPWAGGHVPAYQSGGGTSSPFVSDGGPAGGGSRTPVQEMGLVAPPYQNGNLPPYVGTGTGPLGSNWCDYDAPLSSAAGYHYLCLSPNSSNGYGVLDFGAVGASPIPFYFVLNGVSYNITQSLPTFAPNSVLVTTGTQTEWSTTLPTGLNLQTPSAIDLANATLCAISSCVSGLGTGVVTALENPVNGANSILTSPTTLTSNLPLIWGSGSIAQGSRSGTTTTFGTTTGTLTNGDCVSIGTGGNLIDAGGPCGTGTGSGTVNAASAGQFAWYVSSGNAVSGFSPGADVATALGNALNTSGGMASYGTQTLQNTWFNEPSPGPGYVAQIDRTTDRDMLGAAAVSDGDYYPSGGCPGTCRNGFTIKDWWATWWNGHSTITGYDVPYAQVAVLADPGALPASSAIPQIGFLTAIESANAVSGSTPRALESIAYNNPTVAGTPTKSAMWSYYLEAHTYTNAGETYGIELEVRNDCCSASAWSPYSTPQNAAGGPTIGMATGCGAGLTATHSCEVAWYIEPNPEPFETGIDFLNGSIDSNGPGSSYPAITMPYNYDIQWYSSGTTLAAQMSSDSSSNLVLYSVGSLILSTNLTGTPASYACFTSSNQLIKSATAC